MNPQPILLEHVAMERQTAWRAGGAARFGYAPSSEQKEAMKQYLDKIGAI